jgi:hypothetical protein
MCPWNFAASSKEAISLVIFSVEQSDVMVITGVKRE